MAKKRSDKQKEVKAKKQTTSKTLRLARCPDPVPPEIPLELARLVVRSLAVTEDEKRTWEGGERIDRR